MSNKSDINYFKEKIRFRFNHQEEIRKWVATVIKNERKTFGTINFIFCSDLYLRKMNRQYLSHDYNTDIITFDTSMDKVISGDIYISIDRIRHNAKEYSVSFDDELHRVIIHGVLHLLGYDDADAAGKSKMKKLEDKNLSLRRF